MRRITLQPRPDWPARNDKLGFSFHGLPSEDGAPYWRESAAYELTIAEVERLETVTQELFDRCMDAVEHVIRHDRYDEFGIPGPFRPLIKQSWDQDHATVFGRFDLSWPTGGQPKLLEFNADTPTSLIESSAAQWFWLQDVFPHHDQFNSLHEKLIEQWRHIRTQRWQLPEGAPLHMASLHNAGDNQLLSEDYDNVAYMAETARAAGFSPRQLFMEDISWDATAHRFTDVTGQSISHLYKLYPWEWLVTEAYAPHIITSWPTTSWIEPIWKMLLSNKQLLVVLWELFPDHPALLPAYANEAPLKGKPRVHKPKLGREGANITIHDAQGTTLAQQPGGYGSEGYIWQAYASLPQFDGWHPVIGSWIVGDEPAGIGLRETSGHITGDLAFFVPHYIT